MPVDLTQAGPEERDDGLILYSRTVLVGNRKFTIHEMTESEISLMKIGRFAWAVSAFVGGLLAGGGYVASICSAIVHG